MSRFQRTIAVLACVAVTLVLAACSKDTKKPTAAGSSASGRSASSAAPSASSSSASSISGSSSASSEAATGPSVTQWPLTTSPTTIPAKGSSRSSDNSRSSAPNTGPSTEVCNRLSGQQLQDALGVTFSSANGDVSACTYNGDDGSKITLSVTAISGDAGDFVQRQEGRCDPGTVHQLSIGDGAFTCRVSGQPTGGVATNGQFLRLVTVAPGSIDPNKGEQGFAQLLGDLA